MELHVLTTTAEIGDIANEWAALLPRSGTGKIHHDYDWFVAGYQTFHRGDRLHVLTLRDEQGALAGIAPLVITPGVYRGVTVRKIGFVKNDQSPANDFIVVAGREEQCLAAFLDHLTRFAAWEFIDLRKMNVAEPSWAVLEKLLEERGDTYGTKENIQSPYIRTDMAWDEFWKRKSLRFRKAIRNKFNRVSKYETLAIEKIAVTSARAPVLDDILNISAHSWKHEIGNDLATREDNWNFYKEICDRLGPAGLISVWLLKFDAVPVAFEFHIQYNDVVYPIRADYDKRYKDISPGSLLEYEIIKSIFGDATVAEYNSCGHTYDYLLNWTDTTRIHRNCEIFGTNPKMALLYLYEYRVLAAMRACRAVLTKRQ